VRTTVELIRTVLDEVRSLDPAEREELEADLRASAEHETPAQGCIARAIADVCDAIADGSPAAADWADDLLAGYRWACLLLAEDERNELAGRLRAEPHDASGVFAAFADLMTDFRSEDRAVPDRVRNLYTGRHELLIAVAATGLESDE
jgi:hypothetical protein